MSKDWKRLRAAVLARDGYRCTVSGCGTAHVLPNVDHRVPRSKGGADIMSNLRTLCQPCHSRLTRYRNVGSPRAIGAHVDGTPRATPIDQKDWKSRRFG
jgi:5-methylcytosine-specific restriction endonuclease McrA